MAAIGPRCHELRVKDKDHEWRIVTSVEPDAIVILEVFGKKTAKTPSRVIESSKQRLKQYHRAAKGGELEEKR